MGSILQLHRIFCATPWELEADRIRFHELVGQVNENSALPLGILFIPVSLAGIRDKRPLQYTVDENIRAVRHYVLILEEGWGPPERNFKHDYAVARECLDDPAQPMKSITVLTKGVIEDTGFPAADATYFKRGEFDACIVGLLNGWLQELCLGKGDKS